MLRRFVGYSLNCGKLKSLLKIYFYSPTPHSLLPTPYSQASFNHLSLHSLISLLGNSFEASELSFHVVLRPASRKDVEAPAN